VACLGQAAPRGCLKPFGEGEELGFKVVKREAPVIQRAVGSQRVLGVVKRGAGAPGDIEAAGHADQADGVQTVGVLQDAGFQCFRSDAGGKAVRCNGMGHGCDARDGPAQACQDLVGPLGREARGLGPERRGLLDRDAIVKQRGGQQDLYIATLCGQQLPHVGPHPQDVAEVVRAVAGAGGVGQKPGGEGVMRVKSGIGHAAQAVAGGAGCPVRRSRAFALRFAARFGRKPASLAGMSAMTHRVAILGASGYTGAELVRLLATHPDLRIVALSADRKAGQSMAEVFPFLRHLNLPRLVKIDEIDFSGVDLCFCALPHATTQAVIAGLPRDLKIVDLSADFRLRDPAEYEKWYGQPHAAVEVQKEAVYGLTEFYRDEIRDGRLIAGTGCNAATGQYALRPLIAAGVIDLDDILIDLKAGVSGAGRSLKENLLHAELSGGTHTYSAGGKHRHLGEFDQEFSKIAGRPVRVQFTPHLLPMNRGILATVYVKGDPSSVHATLAAAYAEEPFLKVLPFGALPSTRDIAGSNFCHIGVIGDRIPGRAVVVAVLDNLTKGSSGQAIQNANLMLGIEETTGLMLAPVFP
jgi:N-acetyl-gamma-glutamyl-phosphate reductase